VRHVPLENPFNTLYKIVLQKNAVIWMPEVSYVDGF